MKLLVQTTLVIGLLFPVLLSGQTENLVPCATKDGKSDWLIEYQQNPDLFPNTNDTLYVPLTIHLVGDDDDTGYFGERAVRIALCQLNIDFEESAIQFYIKGDVNYIANSVYNNHSFQEGGQMMAEYLVPSTINCYFVDSPAGACGYSSYNLGVALAEDCVGPQSHTWAHELGHYLSLPHTFLGWEGFTHDYDLPAPVQIGNFVVERVDGLNCQIAADGFCDTPPDYLNYRWFCPSDGFSVEEQLDPDSVSFHSDGSFFMGYPGDECMNRFSAEQIAAMRANILDEKPDHLDQDTPLPPVDISAFSPISPEEGAFIDNFSTVEFAWEPIPGATNYYLEVSIFPNFTLIIFNEETTETSLTAAGLPPNFDLYWRITAHSNWDTCEKTSDGASFSTGAYSATVELPGLESLIVSPNPVQTGSNILLQMEMNRATDAVVELLDLSGRILTSEYQAFPVGRSDTVISTNQLSAGLYLLRIRSENGMTSRKLVLMR